MKKLVFLVFLFLPCFCFSQKFDLKHYSDYYQNFDGWAKAEYIDALKDDNLKYSKAYLRLLTSEFEDKKLKIVKKMTKQNTWLIQKAMDEWEYKEGEVYVAACASSEDADEGILFFIIVNEKKDFDWVAFYFSEDDLEKLDDLFSE